MCIGLIVLNFYIAGRERGRELVMKIKSSLLYYVLLGNFYEHEILACDY